MRAPASHLAVAASISVATSLLALDLRGERIQFFATGSVTPFKLGWGEASRFRKAANIVGTSTARASNGFQFTAWFGTSIFTLVFGGGSASLFTFATSAFVTFPAVGTDNVACF